MRVKEDWTCYSAVLDRHERQLAASACGEQRQDVKGRHRTKFIAVKYHALF